MAEPDRGDTPVALVTGASRGLGRAIAVELAGLGQHVIVNYKINRREAEEALNQIKERGGAATLFQADVSQPDQVQAMFQAVFKAHRRLDILINNAGITRDDYFLTMRQQSWDDVIANDLGARLMHRREPRQEQRLRLTPASELRERLVPHGHRHRRRLTRTRDQFRTEPNRRRFARPRHGHCGVQPHLQPRARIGQIIP